MFTRMTWLFYKVIVLQIIKVPYQNLTRPSLHAFCPFGLISRACPIITKIPHICNNIKNVVSFSYKFLGTHHACRACYHFGTGIPSVSRMQRSTRRVNSIRDLCSVLLEKLIIYEIYSKPEHPRLRCGHEFGK